MGIWADGAASTGGIKVTIVNSTVFGNPQRGISATTSSGHAPTLMTLDRVTAANNGNAVTSVGTGANIRVGNSVITGNGTGVHTASGGVMRSYKNNQIFDNTVNGTPVTALALE